MRFTTALVGALLATGTMGVAQAQTQIRPRVLLMVDTSGSMTDGFTTGNTGGDGSTYFHDSVMTRDFSVDKNESLYVGHMLAPISCVAPPATLASYDGVNSRLYAAKAAVSNVINASGDIDWGLMRYTGTECAMVTPGFTVDKNGVANLNVPEPPGRCTKDADCLNGKTCDTTTSRCHCNTASVALDCNFGGTWTCSAATGGLCTPSANASCGVFGNRSGGICICRNSAVCNNAICNGGICNCAGGGNDSCSTRAPSTICNTGTRQCGCLGGAAINADGSCNCASAAQCGGGETCPGGFCGAATVAFTPTAGACAVDQDCANGEFCVGGLCGIDNNLCWINGANGYQLTDTRNGNTCANHQVPFTYAGNCGTADTGGLGSACGTPRVCYTDADCNGATVGSCVALPGSASKVCGCNGNGPGTCDGVNYVCDTGGSNVCVYALGCQRIGGTILVDPATQPSSAVLEYVNNRQDYADNGSGKPTDDELRAVGLTPLAGAARSATTWYNSVVDSKKACRPYVLVQLTDGADTCDADANNGPVAAAAAFVAATVPGARVLNKVYVIGLAFAAGSTAILDNIAHAGGTGTARLANSQAEIQAALADIVSSSVLVEKCNNTDDDCNGVCDEPFPDVALTAANGCAPRAAKTCDNNATVGTKCFATGAFVCSASQFAEECNAPNCTVGSPFFDAAHCPTAETCNGQDDDCNGVIDDCTPFVPGSCCVGMCPACNPTGVPQPETCNGCDDDCDGVADNHLTDSGIACGSSVGICVQGTTACCQQVNPTVGSCSTDPVTQSAVHNNPDKLACLGGFGPGVAACNGLDNDCDGVKDPAARSCYPFGSGTPGQGSCVAGTQNCTTNPLPAGDPSCPVGWPAGKPCPNPAASYGACVGANGPATETCNNVDDDCDGTRDDNLTDPWVGQPCCPTGNLADCTNSGGSTTCGLGAYACVGGGKTCVGGRAKTTEICDGADNDCNGVVDDVLGKNAPCSGPGIVTGGECTARYQCTGSPGPGPNGLTCVQVIGPQPETCNLMDDDCNGIIDDNLADPRVGVSGGSPCPALTPLPGTSFPVSGPAPPCNPGVTACVNGNVVCNGFQGPEPNQCDGISRDCTGMANSNGNCPTGFMCYQGNCVSQCAGGEFPCPGGFVCVMGLCIPDACNKAMCAADQICKVDVNGNAVCEDPCKNVNCPTGYRCKQGACVDDSCRTFGCPTGQICTGSPPTCVDDPCFNVMCPAGQYCSGGSCVMPCTGMCPPGEECVGGQCVMDPCANLRCPSGQVCAVSGGVGMCVDDLCAATGCSSGSACCGGQCIVDPCASQSCPSGTVCELTSACGTRCAEPPPGDKVQIVPAGGGGISCTAVPGAPARSNVFVYVSWLAVAAFLAARRRRARS